MAMIESASNPEPTQHRQKVPYKRRSVNHGRGGQQIRRITVTPKKHELIEAIELVNGPDSAAPIIMAVTIERM